MSKTPEQNAWNDQIVPQTGAARFLAVDVGGTKTDYVLANRKAILARVRGGCIKRMRVDAPTAQGNLEQALGQLAAASGCNLADVERTCVGTAGETVPLVTDWLRAEISTRVGGELEIVGDVEIALDAAFQGGPGVLVIAGTGSNVGGRTYDGQLVGAGGWGPQLADQGSGHRIGLGGLRAAFLARDEGRSTTLMDEVLRFWKLASPHELVAYANRIPAPDYSRLSHIVHDCAKAGDAVAAAVLRQEGEDLGYLVRLVLRRIQASDTGQDAYAPLGIAFTGSVAEHVPAVRQALLEHVRMEFDDVVAVDGVVDPPMGALWRARRISRAV